jgi:hypothetical protein
MSVSIFRKEFINLDSVHNEADSNPLIKSLTNDLLDNGFKSVGPTVTKITISDEDLTRYIDEFIIYHYDTGQDQLGQGAYGIKPWNVHDTHAGFAGMTTAYVEWAPEGKTTTVKIDDYFKDGLGTWDGLANKEVPLWDFNLSTTLTSEMTTAPSEYYTLNTWGMSTLGKQRALDNNVITDNKTTLPWYTYLSNEFPLNGMDAVGDANDGSEPPTTSVNGMFNLDYLEQMTANGGTKFPDAYFGTWLGPPLEDYNGAVWNDKDGTKNNIYEKYIADINPPVLVFPDAQDTSSGWMTNEYYGSNIIFGPNTELFSYLNPHPQSMVVGKSGRGVYRKGVTYIYGTNQNSRAKPGTGTSNKNMGGLVDWNPGYHALGDIGRAVYNNEFNKIKRCICTGSRGVTMSAVTSEKNNHLESTEQRVHRYFKNISITGEITHDFYLLGNHESGFFPPGTDEDSREFSFLQFGVTDYTNSSPSGETQLYGLQIGDVYRVDLVMKNIKLSTRTSPVLEYCSVVVTNKGLESSDLSDLVYTELLSTSFCNPTSGLFTLEKSNEVSSTLSFRAVNPEYSLLGFGTWGQLEKHTIDLSGITPISDGQLRLDIIYNTMPNFPTSPSHGDPHILGLITYTYDSGVGATAFPTSPMHGDIEVRYGVTYTYSQSIDSWIGPNGEYGVIQGWYNGNTKYVFDEDRIYIDALSTDTIDNIKESIKYRVFKHGFNSNIRVDVINGTSNVIHITVNSPLMSVSIEDLNVSSTSQSTIYQGTLVDGFDESVGGFNNLGVRRLIPPTITFSPITNILGFGENNHRSEFPTTPSNSDVFTVGGITYTYDSSSTNWVSPFPTTPSDGDTHVIGDITYTYSVNNIFPPSAITNDIKKFNNVDYTFDGTNWLDPDLSDFSLSSNSYKFWTNPSGTYMGSSFVLGFDTQQPNTEATSGSVVQWEGSTSNPLSVYINGYIPKMRLGPFNMGVDILGNAKTVSGISGGDSLTFNFSLLINEDSTEPWKDIIGHTVSLTWTADNNLTVLESLISIRKFLLLDDYINRYMDIIIDANYLVISYNHLSSAYMVRSKRPPNDLGLFNIPSVYWEDDLKLQSSTVDSYNDHSTVGSGYSNSTESNIFAIGRNSGDLTYGLDYDAINVEDIDTIGTSNITSTGGVPDYKHPDFKCFVLFATKPKRTLDGLYTNHVLNVESNVNDEEKIRISFHYGIDFGTFATPPVVAQHVYYSPLESKVENSTREFCSYAISYKQAVLQTQYNRRPTGPNCSFRSQFADVHPWRTVQPSSEYNDIPRYNGICYFKTFKKISDFSVGPIVVETDVSNPIIGTGNEQYFRIRFDVTEGHEVMDTSQYVMASNRSLNLNDTTGTIPHINKSNLFTYLQVNIATEYQLHGDGGITEITTQTSDEPATRIVRPSGFLAEIKPQYSMYSKHQAHIISPIVERVWDDYQISKSINNNAGRVGIRSNVFTELSQHVKKRLYLFNFSSNPTNNTDAVSFVDSEGQKITITQGLLENGEYKYENSWLKLSSNELIEDRPYNTEHSRMGKGWFKRDGKSDQKIAGQYPMNYHLTILNHGISLLVQDQSASTEADDFAWFVVQRHVDQVTGLPDWVSDTQPIHCVYMSSKLGVVWSNFTPYFNDSAIGIHTSVQNRLIYNEVGNTVNEYWLEVMRNPEYDEIDVDLQSRFKRYVVREIDSVKPWDKHVYAGLNSIDSHAVINPLEQLAFNEEGKLIIHFPTRLSNQRFIFGGSELDMVAFTDAGAVAEDSYTESTRYGGNFKRYYKGFMSTRPFGNGMRIMLLVKGFGVQYTYGFDPQSITQ